MQSKDMLAALFIRKDIETLSSIVDKNFSRKKQNRVFSSTHELAGEFSIFNFMDIKPKGRPQFFIAREQLRKYRLSKQQENENEQARPALVEDLRKFKLLQCKIVRRPTLSFSQNHIELKSKILKAHIVRLFPDTELDTVERDNQARLSQLRNNNRIRCENQLSEVKAKMIMVSSQFQKVFAIKQLCQSYDQQKMVGFNQFASNSDSLEASLDTKIQEFIKKVYLRLVHAVKLEDFLQKSKIIKRWDSGLLLKEERDFVSKRIKGKLLYSNEQKTAQIKQKLFANNLTRQYLIRQKKYGLHQKEVKKNCMNPLQLDEAQPPQVVLRETRPNRSNIYQQSQRQGKRRQSETRQVPNAYEQSGEGLRPKSKSQLVQYRPRKYEAPLTNPTTQPLKVKHFDASHIVETKVHLNNNKPSRNKRLAQVTNRASLCLQPNTQQSQSFSQFQQFAYHNQIRSSFRQSLQNRLIKQPQSEAAVRGGVNGIGMALKYPIKIDSLEIYSPDYSVICYHVEQISLKELSLRFIKDRLNFQENRVKVEYPFRYSTEEEERVVKSMQILNCLGAEVLSEPQSGYKFWNDIDGADILAVGWLLELPTREVVHFYSQFLSQTLTKK